MDPRGFSASSCSVGASRTQTGLIILKTMRDHTGPDPAQSPGRCLLTLLSPTLTLLFMEGLSSVFFSERAVKNVLCGNQSQMWAVKTSNCMHGPPPHARARTSQQHLPLDAETFQGAALEEEPRLEHGCFLCHPSHLSPQDEETPDQCNNERNS